MAKLTDRWRARGARIGLALCLGLTTAAAAAQDIVTGSQRFDGQFLEAGVETPMTVTNRMIDGDDHLDVSLPGLPAQRVEVIGAVQSIEICRATTQPPDNLRIVTCDSGSGPNCQEIFVYADPAVGRLKSDIITEYVPDWEEEAAPATAEPVACGRIRYGEVAGLYDHLQGLWGDAEARMSLHGRFGRDEGEGFTVAPVPLTSQQMRALMQDLEPHLGSGFVPEVLLQTGDWRILSIAGTRPCHAGGIVIAEHWPTHTSDAGDITRQILYPIASGCSKRLNFPPRNLELKGSRLIADFCTDCSWWGAYARFEWDLKSHEVRRVGPALEE